MEEILRLLNEAEREAPQEMKELIGNIRRICRNIEAKYQKAANSFLYDDWKKFRDEFEK